MPDTITIPTSEATTRQLATLILKELTHMAEQIDRLNTAVDRELADDTAQQQLITELRGQIAQARAAADQATAGEQAAVQAMQTALDAAEAAAARLESNDTQAAPDAPVQPAPVEPTPVTDPAPVTDPTPVAPAPQPAPDAPAPDYTDPNTPTAA